MEKSADFFNDIWPCVFSTRPSSITIIMFAEYAWQPCHEKQYSKEVLYSSQETCRKKKSLADETVNSCVQKREKALKATKSMFDIA